MTDETGAARVREYKQDCNYYVNGTCHTLACVKRGSRENPLCAAREAILLQQRLAEVERISKERFASREEAYKMLAEVERERDEIRKELEECRKRPAPSVE